MATFGDFKTAVRQRIFVTGEAPNLIPAHDKSFIDAVIDIQKFVECFQIDNTTIVAQCATTFDCGLTRFDAPVGRIKRLSVIGGAKPASTTLEGTLTLPTVLALGQYSYGTFAAGNYQIQYVNGALIFETVGGTPQWTVSNPVTRTPTINILSGTQVIPITLPNGALVTAGSQAAAEAAFAGVVINFVHPGGDISLQFQDSPLNDNAEGSPNPTFALYQINPEDDGRWQTEIDYAQISPIHVTKYLEKSRHLNVAGGCAYGFNPFLYFGIVDFCDFEKTIYPRPTDAGVPTGLPVLPFGQHYGQPSTDLKFRARRGKWAIQRGQIFVAPWINSTESIVVRWDGLKRYWPDSDPVSDNPTFERAVAAFVLRDHYAYYVKDLQQSQAALEDYETARQDLWHECRQETRVRGLEPSLARGDVSTVSSTAPTTSLYYNTAQTATVACPTGQYGSASAITVAANTVSSEISVADANTQALALATTQASAALNCNQEPPVFYNNPVSFTATCGTSEAGAPNPTGTAVTVNIAAGQYSSSISVDDATSQALTVATASAQAQLQCTYWNAAQSYTANVADYAETLCSGGTLTGSSITATVAAGSISSSISQAGADAAALNAAKVQAELGIHNGTATTAPWVCTIDSAPSTPSTPFLNTQQMATTQVLCTCPEYCVICEYVEFPSTGVVLAGAFSSFISQTDANNQAYAAALAQAQGAIINCLCSSIPGGPVELPT